MKKAVVILYLLISLGSFSQTIYYVKTTGNDANNGTSWATAFKTVQRALATAIITGDQIWVAAGVYYPDEGNGMIDNDRAVSFSLKNEVAVYGGFAGTESLLSQRNWTLNTTTLSGDIDQVAGNAANSYHVIKNSSVNNTAILDGFTITDGNANVSGNNQGGGIYNANSSPTLTNCIFSANSAFEGGGIYNASSSSYITNCSFTGNIASRDGGAGMYLSGTESTTIINCTFSKNNATGLFSSGGALYIYLSSPIISNCSFATNTATAGSAIVISSASPTLANCIVWGNGDEIATLSGSPTVSYSIVKGGYAGTGNLDRDPIFVDPANSNLRLRSCSPAINIGNNAALILNPDLDGNPRIVNTTIDMGAFEFQGSFSPCPTGIYYVRTTGNDANDGLSWATAFKTVQKALAAPILSDDHQIWVAGGVYYPDEGNGFIDNDRAVSFSLINEVAVYGGFAGTESLLSQRNWTINVTVLSGDIDQVAGNTGNSYHVIKNSSVNNTAILDGFTITDGNAESSTNQLGGGIWNINSSPAISNCIFSLNNAAFEGGGIYNQSSSSSFTNCSFTGNNAFRDGGGGIYNNNSSLTLTNCNFISNTATNGGGILNSNSSTTLLNCDFSGNSTIGLAGIWGGAGIANLSSSSANLTDCNFNNNNSHRLGGGIHSNNSSLTLSGGTFTGNSARNGGGMYNLNSTISVSNCGFSLNSALEGGAVHNLGTDYAFNRCSFTSNTASRDGGGAMYLSGGLTNRIFNCTFSKNNTTDLISQGGALYNYFSSPLISNCSFATNTATAGGAIVNNNSSPALANCILWGNGDEIVTLSGSPTVIYSIVKGGYAGTGNLDKDPIFVDPVNNNLRLRSCSPAIDVGNNALTLNPDLDGNTRIINTTVDMGAFEFQGSFSPCPPGIYYVKTTGSDANDGLSWATAFKTVQKALSAPILSDDHQIWVAAGVYYPDEGNGMIDNDRAVSFSLINEVAVYGGFAGTESLLSQRNWTINVTTLSGDIDQVIGNAGNSYHVIKNSSVNNTAILDGFTITGGNADGSSNNQGGGIWNINSSPAILNCTLSANTAFEGGGIYNQSSSSSFTNCSFTGNTATRDGGGGIYNMSSTLNLTNCSFTSNTATNGGGILNSNSSTTLSNCIFSTNSSSGVIYGGAGIANLSSSSATLTDCTFSNNTSVKDGGGIFCNNSSITLSGGSITGNNAHNGGGIYSINSMMIVSNCSFSSNSALEGGAVYNSSTNYFFNRCSFTGNTASRDGGGGMYLSAGTSNTIINCTFSKNYTTGSTSKGGALYIYSSSPYISNCSFATNTATGGGAMIISSATPTLVNCIVWGNGDEIATLSGSATVSYSIVKSGYAGVGNLNKDPLFVDATNNNLRLQNCSPAIDVGNNAASILNPDLDGNTRIVNTTVDMGAFEFQGPVSLLSITCPGNLNVNGCSTADIKTSQNSPSGLSYSTTMITITQSAFEAEGGSIDVNSCPIASVSYQDAIDVANSTATKTVVNRTFSITDIKGANQSCIQIITIEDKTAPTIIINGISANSLWPPNHTMKEVTVGITSTDNCGGSNTCAITSVSSNEPENGTGDGDLSPDWQMIAPDKVMLRAERAGNGDGRIYTITITCTDASGNTATQTTTVRVSHNITVPQSGKPFKIGSTVNFSGEFWDKPGNKHTAKWLIDGSAVANGIVTEPSGNQNGKVTGSNKFNSAGVYKLRMNVTDQTGITSYANTNGDLDAIVVIYDPNGGYTYGGGWFASPAGALTANAAASGKASFGFAVNYKNATNPKGETQFEFKVGNFEFNALNFDYLVVSGAKAQFRGTGKITGGQSGIGFIMTVIDGEFDGTGIDKIRMKVYNRNTNAIIYDNQPGASDADDPITAIGANSEIFIQESSVPPPITNKNNEVISEAMQVKSLEIMAYPNPTSNSFSLTVQSDLNEKILMQVMDMYGRVIETITVTANSVIRFGDRYNAGVYFVRVVQGNEHKELKLVKLD